MLTEMGVYSETALAARIDNVLAGLDRLQTANDSAQIGLVDFYLWRMRVDISMAHLSIVVSPINFSSLVQSVEAMVGLTGDFIATLRGWAKRASDSIQTAADDLRHRLWRLARGVRTLVRRLQQRHRSEASEA